jgi:hypothetical protein
MRRKGELSPLRGDREWPHQIILPANECLNQQYKIIHEFCADLSLYPRGHSIFKDDKWHHVYCFAEREHAERFQARFGGEWCDPTQRGRGSSWMKVKPPAGPGTLKQRHSYRSAQE